MNSGTNDAEQVVGVTKAVVDRAEAELKKARERCQEFCDQAKQRVAEMQEKTVGDVMTELMETIRANPGKAIVTAGVVGYLLGRIVRR